MFTIVSVFSGKTKHTKSKDSENREKDYNTCCCEWRQILQWTCDCFSKWNK